MRRYIPGAACWWPTAPGASAQLRPMPKPLVASAGLSILGREGVRQVESPLEGARWLQTIQPSADDGGE